MSDGAFGFNLSQEQLRAVYKHCPHLEHFDPNLPTLNPIFLQRKTAWARAVIKEVLQTEPSERICKIWSEETIQILADEFNKKCAELGVFDLALFAVGKLGSYELNLSSDVDLLFVSRETNPLHMQVIRDFTEQCAKAYRLDYDLRPGGRMASLVSSIEQFEDYYGNYGEPWERLALIRLNFIAGDNFIRERILEFRDRFCFRRFLEYGLVEDLKTLRQKIQAQLWSKTENESINIKLCLGGIRDVELFVHTLQIIYGGKSLSLRTPCTGLALSQLAASQLIDPKDAEFLRLHYWSLRRIENLIQAREDLQTHSLKLQQADFLNLEQLTRDLDRARAIIDGLLGIVDANKRSLPETELEQLNWLETLGFEPTKIHEVWSEINRLPVLSRNKSRDMDFRSYFIYDFVSGLGKKGYQGHQAYYYLRDFLKSTKAKTSFFGLLAGNPKITTWISNLFASSPFYSQALCLRPEFLDNLLLKQEVDTARLEVQDLAQLLLDKKILAEIDLASQFIQSKDLETLESPLSHLADEICNSLLVRICSDNQTDDFEFLSLGKWGSQELGFQSDLDFIFITQKQADNQQLRSARKFLTTVTEARMGGVLYRVDMRLRPQEHAGVVISSADKLIDYLRSKAQPWELQAYTRARSPSLGVELKEALLARNIEKTDLVGLWRIQQELHKTRNSELDLKLAPGGIVDIELYAQTIALQEKNLSNGKPQAILSSIYGERHIELIANLNFLRVLEQLLRVVSTETKPTLKSGCNLFVDLGRVLQKEANTVEERVRSALSENLRILSSLDPRRRQG